MQFSPSRCSFKMKVSSLPNMKTVFGKKRVQPAYRVCYDKLLCLKGKKLAFLLFCHFLLLPYDIRIFSGSNFSLYFRIMLGMCLSFPTLSPCIIFTWVLGMHSFTQQTPLDCATAVPWCVGIRFASQLVIVVI